MKFSTTVKLHDGSCETSFQTLILERLSMTFTANGKNNSDFAHFFFST